MLIFFLCYSIWSSQTFKICFLFRDWRCINTAIWFLLIKSLDYNYSYFSYKISISLFSRFLMVYWMCLWILMSSILSLFCLICLNLAWLNSLSGIYSMNWWKYFRNFSMYLSICIGSFSNPWTKTIIPKIPFLLVA